MSVEVVCLFDFAVFTLLHGMSNHPQVAYSTPDVPERNN